METPELKPELTTKEKEALKKQAKKNIGKIVEK
jgi:hypothetical protein